MEAVVETTATWPFLRKARHVCRLPTVRSCARSRADRFHSAAEHVPILRLDDQVRVVALERVVDEPEVAAFEIAQPSVNELGRDAAGAGGDAADPGAPVPRDVVADQTSDVMRNWEQIKKEEKGTTSIVDGITPGLPSLLYTHKLFRKAASVGLEIDDVDAALDRIDAALAGLRSGDDAAADAESHLAQILAATVIVARASGVDAVRRRWRRPARGSYDRATIDAILGATSAAK